MSPGERGGPASGIDRLSGAGLDAGSSAASPRSRSLPPRPQSPIRVSGGIPRALDGAGRLGGQRFEPLEFRANGNRVAGRKTPGPVGAAERHRVGVRPGPPGSWTRRPDNATCRPYDSTRRPSKPPGSRSRRCRRRTSRLFIGASTPGTERPSGWLHGIRPRCELAPERGRGGGQRHIADRERSRRSSGLTWRPRSTSRRRTTRNSRPRRRGSGPRPSRGRSKEGSLLTWTTSAWSCPAGRVVVWGRSWFSQPEALEAAGLRE